MYIYPGIIVNTNCFHQLFLVPYLWQHTIYSISCSLAQSWTVLQTRYLIDYEKVSLLVIYGLDGNRVARAVAALIFSYITNPISVFADLCYKQTTVILLIASAKQLIPLNSLRTD